MVNRKTYGRTKTFKKGRFSRRASTYLVVVFIFFGLIINVIPMTSFFFGTYVHDPIHNPTKNGSELEYYGFYGAAPGPNLTGYGFGFEIQIRNIGNNQYNLAETVFNVSGNPVGMNLRHGLDSPFIGSTITKVYSNTGIYSYSESPFLQLVLPENTTPVSKYLRINITETSKDYPAEPYLGYPSYLNVTSVNQSVINYIKIDGQYVLANFEYNSDFGKFFQTLDPAAMILPSFVSSTIVLASGNVAISQNWFGWATYGFGISYPVNAALLVVGTLLAIIRFRKG